MFEVMLIHLHTVTMVYMKIALVEVFQLMLLVMITQTKDMFKRMIPIFILVLEPPMVYGVVLLLPRLTKELKRIFKT